MQPHIRLSDHQSCRYAVLPGDPGRIDRIASYLERVEDLGTNREYRSVRGLWRGVPILAISTGMGGPSAAIAIEELKHIGVTTLLRIGSCGALQSGLAVGDLILAQGAVRDEGTSQAYVPLAYPAMADFSLLTAVVEAAGRSGLGIHTGIVRSHDALYADQQSQKSSFWSQQRVLASDMETAAFLTVASLRGLRAAAILNNVVRWGEDTAEGIGSYADHEQQAELGEQRSIVLALESCALLAQREETI